MRQCRYASATAEQEWGDGMAQTMKLVRLYALCAQVVCMAAGAAAQPATTTLTGRVVDPSDSIVPGASVRLRRIGTDAEWSVPTDAEGRFVVPALPPSDYDVRVEMAGFAPWTTKGLTLPVGQELHLEVKLALGAIEAVVEIEDAALSYRTAAIKDVIGGTRIESLPLNGRNFLELSFLLPGSQPTPTFDPTKTNSVLVSSAGQLGRGGNITIDGQDNNDDVVGGPLLNLPIDAVQEFEIATSRFSADLGRSASSAINVVTRSGSNDLRGTGALFLRDDAWQGLPATADRSGDAPPFDRQQWAGSAGGPLRTGRAWWFGAAEYRNQDGAVLVGARDTAARTIRRSFAPAPLDDGLWLVKGDFGSAASNVSVRYAGERAEDTSASAVERAIGSATQRQTALNRYHDLLGTWQSVRSSTFFNALSVSLSTFFNHTDPTATAPQFTFPSIQDGASFRMPQETKQTRFQIANATTLARGDHTVKFGGEFQRIDAAFGLGVFRQGRIELVQDFPSFDHTGDGRIDDNDLLFAVTLRSGKPDQDLVIPDADNVHVAAFVQDDWRLSPNLTLNLGLRYEIDTDVNNQSRVGELNPIVQPFVTDERQRDMNNFGPRIGFVWTPDAATVVRGGYGAYYDRIVLQIQSLERGLDGRALPIEVRAGNTFFVDPLTGRLPPGAPTLASPFTGFILPGAGASGINIIDPHLQSPMVHAFNLGVERELFGTRLRADVLHSQGIYFLIGRTVGEVFNPVVGGPDRVVNIESSARTKYDALLLSADTRFGSGATLRASYTLAKAFNYANDDQIPFLNGPIDPNDLRREFGPTPNDRRHRFVTSVQAPIPGGVQLAGIWTMSSGVPMDIMLPDGSTRVPPLQRNAGGRQFTSVSDLNAYLGSLNASGGVNGELLPLVDGSAHFNDGFNALDLRVSRPFRLGARVRVEPVLELFNVFNVTNILGTTNVNYSGFNNALVRDSDAPGAPGYLTSSSFGRAVTTAGGVFGSGGPRALQLAARVSF
jgi:Carboxypeptidase regulatory-like domain/TonB dependent receptor